MPRMKKDEDYVHKVIDTFRSWINPFPPKNKDEPLGTIAPVVRALAKITDDLFSADQKGDDVFITFVKTQMQTSEVTLFAPLT